MSSGRQLVAVVETMPKRAWPKLRGAEFVMGPHKNSSGAFFASPTEQQSSTSRTVKDQQISLTSSRIVRDVDVVESIESQINSEFPNKTSVEIWSILDKLSRVESNKWRAVLTTLELAVCGASATATATATDNSSAVALDSLKIKEGLLNAGVTWCKSAEWQDKALTSGSQLEKALLKQDKAPHAGDSRCKELRYLQQMENGPPECVVQVPGLLHNHLQVGQDLYLLKMVQFIQ